MAKILIIDDEPMIRKLVIKMLCSSEAAHTFTQAKDGVEGMRRFIYDTPDLVITDIVMPDREGIETIREIRRLDAAVKILAVSGGSRMGGMDVLIIAKKLGADMVLNKPLTSAELQSAVAQLLA